MINIQPNNQGVFGTYGGQYIDDDLKIEFDKIEKVFNDLKNDKNFLAELDYYNKRFLPLNDHL